MKFGFREPDRDERQPQRVLIWESGATTDVKVLVLTAGALAVLAASLAVAVSQEGPARYVASDVAVVAGLYSAVLLFGLAVAFDLNRLDDDDDADA